MSKLIHYFVLILFHFLRFYIIAYTTLNKPFAVFIYNFSMTQALLQTGLPSFDTVLHNGALCIQLYVA